MVIIIITTGQTCKYLFAQSTHSAVTVTLPAATVTIPILQIKKLRLRKELAPSRTTNGGAQIHQSALLSPGEALQRAPPCPPLAPHLQDFALGTLRKQQHLIIQWVQRLASDFGLLLGDADAVLQQVGLDVGG